MSDSRYPLYKLVCLPEAKAGFFSKPIRETHGTVGSHVAAQHGVEVVANGFRCPPNREFGGTFTDAMGTTCGLAIVESAIEDVLAGVARVATGERVTTGREGGKGAAILAKNEQILGEIERAGGALFKPTPEFIEAHGENGIFGIRPPEAVYKGQRTAAAFRLQNVREYLRTGKAPVDYRGEPLVSQAALDRIHPDTRQMILDMTDDELVDLIERQAVEFHRGVSKNIRVSIPRGQRLEKFLEEGRYLTTHEARSDHSDAEIRRYYETQIGFPRKLDVSLRPASGYVVHPDWEQRARENYQRETGIEPNEHSELPRNVAGQVGIYGGVELVLRPEVSGRSAYGAGDSISTMLRPARFDEEDPHAIFSAMISSGGKDWHTIQHLTLGFLDSARTGSFENVNAYDAGAADIVDPKTGNRTYFEALIPGSFSIEDVAAVRISYDDLAFRAVDPNKHHSGEDALEQTKQIRDEFFSADKLRSMGFSDEEVEYLLGLLDNYRHYNNTSPSIPGEMMIPAVRDLLKFREARQKRQMIESKGIPVQVTDPKGVNRFDPEFYGGKPGDDIEQLLLGKFRADFPRVMREWRKRQEDRERQRAEEEARGEVRTFG